MPLSSLDLFDVASCQFAMHYMFQSVHKARNFLREVSNHLRPGGYFIATTIDCNAVVQLFGQLLFGGVDMAATAESMGIQLFLSDTPGSVQRKEAEQKDEVDATDPFQHVRGKRLLRPLNGNPDQICSAAVSNEAGDTLLRISFRVSDLLRLFSTYQSSNEVDDVCEEEWQKAFGIQYNFTLLDEVGPSSPSASAAVDAPEWIVPQGWPLRRLANEFNLQVVQRQNFHEVVRAAMLDPRKKQRYISSSRRIHSFVHAKSLTVNAKDGKDGGFQLSWVSVKRRMGNREFIHHPCLQKTGRSTVP